MTPDDSRDTAVWISRRPPQEIEQVRAASTGALAGWVVGVKDNIDVAGFPTTAGCPEFAYTPAASAAAVSRLEAAGATIVGKTNMDQFATGLVGTRSPYGKPSCVANPDVISGGSSSGSAVAVALGQCDVALGTDTAGSGRVPAALNGIVGLKPSRGRVPITGVVPACRTLDCVSVFARDVATARLALDVISDPTPAAPRRFGALAGPRVGVPLAIGWDGDEESAQLYADAIAHLERLGATTVPVDFSPFAAAGELLYGGPWVAERFAAVGAFMVANPEATLDPVVREVILPAASVTGPDTFRGLYELAEHTAEAAEAWRHIDVLALPTVVGTPTHSDVAADPHGANAGLGRFTRFVNMLDLCAVSIPAGRHGNAVPFGLQLIAPSGEDLFLCDLAERFLAPAAGEREIACAVVGAHLSGEPLNHQLTTRGARLLEQATTSPAYRLVRLAESLPPKPGLAHVGSGGAAIEVEVWTVPVAAFGSFVAEVPPPLAIGSVELADGRVVKGFVCEPRALDGAEDITHHGGWRAYLRSLATLAPTG